MTTLLDASASDVSVDVTFADLGLPTEMIDQLDRSGMSTPFAIQAAVIPDTLDGRDIAGRAPTGSGKTLGFGLPVVARLTKAKSKRPVALVLAPTRELAEQIMAELTPFTKAMRMYATSIYGGVGYGNQKNALNKGTELVVACPGRLEDLMQMGAIDLRDVATVVIDEADQMADMGFLPAVRRIVGQTRDDRQVLLFSATLDGPVAKLIKDFQHDPAFHEVGPKGPDIHAAHHVFWQVERTERNQNAAGVIDRCGSTIVFTRTRHGADRLAKQLGKLGVSAQPIHGGRSQNQRDRALDAFKQGKADALIATDVAARGIHVNGVSAVIHYDPPADGATYHHRSGRTARAGETGIVVSFVEPGTMKDVKKLQRDVGIQVDVTDPDLDDLEVAVLLSGKDDRTTRPVDVVDAAPAPKEQPQPTKRERVESNAPVPAGQELGTVKFFNASRGYGFIVRDSGGDELFVHFSNIETEGFKTLDEKARVSYAVGEGKKGLEARNVTVR
ncbi:DEAD/DEAH box helicase [Ilumatobacter nonamiensis]|uniref:DEAD/DEAH box helicase n=1 Tax=Ilumatobacter nonamiensis TaxID=467093 RepID=UPI00034D513F